MRGVEAPGTAQLLVPSPESDHVFKAPE
jgi:hypothetical protein